MATDRPRIQGYIEQEVYDRFVEWKGERGMSEALNQLLVEYFGVSQSPIPNSHSPITTLAIEEMVEESNQKLWKEFNAFRAEFKTEVWLQLKKEFAIWNESLQKVADQVHSLERRIEVLEPEAVLLRKLLNESMELAQSMTQKSESPSGLPGELAPLTQTELAKRLGVHKSVISRRREGGDFEDWSRSKDPSGIAWRYDGEKKVFLPL